MTQRKKSCVPYLQWGAALVSSSSKLGQVGKVNVSFQDLLCTTITKMGYGSASGTGQLLLHRHRVGLGRVGPSSKWGKFCRRCSLFNGLKNMSSTTQLLVHPLAQQLCYSGRKSRSLRYLKLEKFKLDIRW